MPTAILPDPCLLVIEKITSESDLVTIIARSRKAEAVCPKCGRAARRVQSRYQRRVKDLPWQGVPVQLELTVRRFFCEVEACPQRIFTERLPTVVAHYGRQTGRLETILRQFGAAAGGNPGVRLLAAVPVSISRQALLRRVRSTPGVKIPPVRVLGVDDFAFRRERTYGTILVDQERKAVVDVLPDREADSWAVWLTAHPEVEIITRDRSHAYATGASQGAPQAIQIADRSHLLQNSTDLLKRVIDREQTALRRAAETVRSRQVTDAVNPAGTASEPVLAPIQAANRQRREEREKARRERFEQVRALYRQGAAIHRIAVQLRMHRRDVRRFIRADAYPERTARPKRGSQLDPFLPYLQQRWEAGCHNSAALFRDIRTQGYRGSDSLLRQVIRRWKVGLPPEFRARPPINCKVAHTLFTPPTVHRTV